MGEHSLREKIERRLASNQVYYAHFVPEHDFPKIRKETADDIISMIEKRIDSRIQYAEHELKKGQHDFEGKQNLRYEIERLQDFKEEILKS